MGRYHVFTLLPCLVASLARAQASDDTAADTSVSAPIYTPEQCNSWVGVLVAADGDASNGLSEDEYYSFLSSIAEPRYIAEYFGGYDGFDQLPWVFRVVHKSLACHCEKLGFGGKCCEGDDAEVLLSGLGDISNLRTSAEDEYKDMFCQQIAYVLTKAISSPAPTAAPSARPTVRPTKAPTVNPSTPPFSATPTTAPVKKATTSPVAAPIVAPPIVAPTSLQPTVTPTQKAVIPGVGTRGGGDDRKSEGALGTGAIIGIVAAAFAVLLAIVALVAYHRRKEEEAHVREFAGDQAPEADLGVPVASRALVPAPELALAREDDDDSLAPSVWSEGEAGDDREILGEVHDDHDGPGVTAGSALAAMGAASTVTARITTASEGIV